MSEAPYEDIWLAAGLILLALEIATNSVFLIGPGLAALLIGVVLYFLPDIGLAPQLAAFAVLSIALTPVCRWASAQYRPDRIELLNDRGASYVGSRATVCESFASGVGRVILDGVPWSAEVENEDDPEEGAMVFVTEVREARLVVSATRPS